LVCGLLQNTGLREELAQQSAADLRVGDRALKETLS
jgi:hypothetical protein